MFDIEQRFISLEQLVKAAGAKGLDEQTASYLCKLGSVLICGNLERCVEVIITTRIAKKSPPQVESFLRMYFKRGTNYDCDEIRELLFRFDSAWGRVFDQFIIDNQRLKESISSCYSVRNSVAHGGGQSLGPSILKQYYQASFDVISELEKIVRE